MANIVVVYYLNEPRIRGTVRDHLYAFRRYARDNVSYVNLAVRAVPRYVLRGVDVLVFHTTFLSQRAWAPERFLEMARSAKILKTSDAVKIALPQDEFVNTDLLSDFINEFGVRIVFSVTPPSEWSKVYERVDRARTRMHQVLTGYLEEGTVARIERLARSISERPIDVGYRAWHAQPWLGRHGLLKVQVATEFQRHAPQRGLVTDISTRSEDTLLGDAWYELLLRCKYTVGVEGGASILDRDGSIRLATEAYVRDHPDAGFDEIEAGCFPGIDGATRLVSLSPRHLEACVTRTCQVLIEGEYNGILKPDVHYIELKRDFSNLADVLDVLKRDSRRAEITERAYSDIVASGQYTYRRFVEFLLEESLSDRTRLEIRTPPGAATRWWARVDDAFSWVLLLARETRGRIVTNLPAPVRAALRRLNRALVRAV